MLSRHNVSNPLLPVWAVPSRAWGADEMMRRLFTDFELAFHRALPEAPPRARSRAQLRDTGDVVHVLVDLPGVRLQDIDLAIEGNTVTLRASAPTPTTPEGFVPLRREREISNAQWSFEAPYPIDVEAVAATLQHGRLSVTLPKAPEAKPRKIPVKAG